MKRVKMTYFSKFDKSGKPIYNTTYIKNQFLDEDSAYNWIAEKLTEKFVECYANFEEFILFIRKKVYDNSTLEYVNEIDFNRLDDYSLSLLDGEKLINLVNSFKAASTCFSCKYSKSCNLKKFKERFK